ncbi:MAG: CTP synthase [Spirochaetales bacterium]|nr:CTP synthase [Spirochaetales bacterium]
MGKNQKNLAILSNLSTASDSGDTYSTRPDGYEVGRTKYIVITGSVMSGLGKGIFAASLAGLLQRHGYSCNLIKMDGYFNEDAGTLSPYRHGEVFVLDDGTECDMDIGTYERFTQQDLSNYNIFTNGRLNKRINNLERKGHFQGGDVQFYPHVTGEVLKFVRESSCHYEADFTLVEIGGTVGDEENRSYINAMSELQYEEGSQNVFFINLVWIIEAGHLNEQKTKAAQHGTQLLMRSGIKPDMIVCRAENQVEDKVLTKLGERLRLKPGYVVDCHNLGTIYQVPDLLKRQLVDEMILSHFSLERAEITSGWNAYLDLYLQPKKSVKVGLTGKYLGPRDTYASIHNAIEHAATNLGVSAEVIDIHSESIETGEIDIAEAIGDVAGIIVPGGFGKRGAEGKITAIQYVRENDVPFLGLCYGFQMAAIEYARNVCGMDDADTTENNPETQVPVICLLPGQYEIEGIGGNMRLGGRDVELIKDSRTGALYIGSRLMENNGMIRERFRHRYELNPDYRSALEVKGLVFSGWAPKQPIMQVLELPEHRFFVGVQYHPEFTSRPTAPNPLFHGFMKACLQS